MFSSYRKLSGSGTNSAGENNIGKWARPNQCIQLFLNIWKARFTQEVESLLIPIVFDYFCKKLNSFIPSPLVTGRLLLGECISYNGTRPVACFRTASRYRKREIRAQNVSSCFVSQVSSSHRFLVAGSLAKKTSHKRTPSQIGHHSCLFGRKNIDVNIVCVLSSQNSLCNQNFYQ